MNSGDEFFLKMCVLFCKIIFALILFFVIYTIIDNVRFAFKCKGIPTINKSSKEILKKYDFRPEITQELKDDIMKKYPYVVISLEQFLFLLEKSPEKFGFWTRNDEKFKRLFPERFYLIRERINGDLMKEVNEEWLPKECKQREESFCFVMAYGDGIDNTKGDEIPDNVTVIFFENQEDATKAIMASIGYAESVSRREFDEAEKRQNEKFREQKLKNAIKGNDRMLKIAN